MTGGESLAASAASESGLGPSAAAAAAAATAAAVRAASPRVLSAALARAASVALYRWVAARTQKYKMKSNSRSSTRQPRYLLRFMTPIPEEEDDIGSASQTDENSSTLSDSFGKSEAGVWRADCASSCFQSRIDELIDSDDSTMLTDDQVRLRTSSTRNFAKISSAARASATKRPSESFRSRHRMEKKIRTLEAEVYRLLKDQFQLMEENLRLLHEKAQWLEERKTLMKLDKHDDANLSGCFPRC